VTEVF